MAVYFTLRTISIHNFYQLKINFKKKMIEEKASDIRIKHAFYSKANKQENGFWV
jgi:hypothetical protein